MLTIKYHAFLKLFCDTGWVTFYNFAAKYNVMKLFLITVALLGLAFAGIAIKIWAKKDGKFAGTCASQSPFLNKDGEACGLCGKLPDEQDCKQPDPQYN